MRRQNLILTPTLQNSDIWTHYCSLILNGRGVSPDASDLMTLPDAAGLESIGRLHLMRLVRKLCLMLQYKEALPNAAGSKSLSHAAGLNGIGDLNVYLSNNLFFIYCISSLTMGPDRHIPIYLWHSILVD